ncbi:PREDICTED: uncharacterized protein LOC106741134 isoform X2 [Dinoponera quadriceps]|uniref:Uncharacterized protein LOC106741134 isoform X2 n=1 Tax=Dinoponera quadriceps TaxID=609295 RepID=A0A6P3WR23_DINQU|nr:PREDICTED: uncharacterized protein LOC106741134 isoform X2 [Dinoponera quadriceps]
MSFHKFNPFTGRLKPATNFQPFYPLKTEQMMIYDTIKTKPATITAKADYCTDKPRTLDPKMWAKYKHFQSDLKKPVYLMGGRKDKVLFGITVALIAVSTAQSLYIVFTKYVTLK